MSSEEEEQDKRIVVGLDIGTSKVNCIVAEITGEGSDKVYNIVGVGSCPSNGLSVGVITDMEETQSAIEKAVNAAQQMVGDNNPIDSVYVGIAGEHIQSVNLSVKITINHGTNGEVPIVTDEDVQRLVEEARSRIDLPPDRQILDVICQDFTLDGQKGIRRPKGMSGTTLESTVHVVTGSLRAARDIINCVKNADLSVRKLILEPIASAKACLTEDEKEVGVCLVDIGHGTTDISCFYKGVLIHSAVIPMGGSYLTKDLVKMLHTTSKGADELKRQYGNVLPDQLSSEDLIEVPTMSGQETTNLQSRQHICTILHDRLYEILEAVVRNLLAAGLIRDDILNAGFVFTGGTSRIENMAKFAQTALDEILQSIAAQQESVPPISADSTFPAYTRIGQPSDMLRGLNHLVSDPTWSTGVGLVICGDDPEFNSDDSLPGVDDPDETGLLTAFKEMLRRFASWI